MLPQQKSNTDVHTALNTKPSSLTYFLQRILTAVEGTLWVPVCQCGARLIAGVVIVR